MLNDLWAQVIAWSGALVAPDWGGLVRLIPLLLLVVVVAFLAITGAKWAVAARLVAGGRRRLPLAPDGRPLESPVVGPLVVAAGVFALAFGLLAGGAWPAAGTGISAAGLTVWLAETRHVPRRPFPRISRTRFGLTVVIAVVVLVLVATAKVVPEKPGSPGGVAGQGVGASSDALPGVTSSGAVPTAASSAPMSTADSSGALPSADATLTARDVAFADPALAAPAGRPFTVAFDNRDGVPHNLEIRGADGSVLFRGDFVTGPAVTVYDVPALPAGAYQFICTIHPAMAGTLTVK